MSEKKSWEFSFSNLEKALSYFSVNGFVGFVDLLQPNDLENLEQAFKETVSAGKLKIGVDEIIAFNDVIFLHETFKQYATYSRILTFVDRILKGPFELQHSKLNCKPIRDEGKGEIHWHQDYPFFPHTNFDLLAVGIHLDDENERSGCLEFILGSHKRGPLTHCKEKEFAYECTDVISLKDEPPVTITGKKGLVTIHHCLTLHRSAPKRESPNRRLLVYQYRACDAIQLAGVIWRCTGYPIRPLEGIRMARFPNGFNVEIRGSSGRLFDKFGKLAPDKEQTNY